MSTEVGLSLTHGREQFQQDALPVAASDSYGYQQQMNPGSLGASLAILRMIELQN